MTNFAERLNELLIERTMRPDVLAQAVDVSVQTVYEWKAGRQIFLSNLVTLCDYFECSVDYIVGRSDDVLDYNPQKRPPFNTAIRAVMAKRKISTYRLRQDTRYDGSYFARWDKGAEPYIGTLIELADYFDCTIDELIGREKV